MSEALGWRYEGIERRRCGTFTLVLGAKGSGRSGRNQVIHAGHARRVLKLARLLTLYLQSEQWTKYIRELG